MIMMSMTRPCDMGAYCFFDNKPKALQGYCIEDTKQLSLF